MEKTLALIKPDAVSRGLIGNVIHRIERRLNPSLEIIGLKMVYMSREKAEAFYSVHKGKPFFDRLVGFMASGPCVALVLEGNNAVENWRLMMGATDKEKAFKGTIRGDLSIGGPMHENIVHGSDSIVNAQVEIGLLFEKGELLW